jgi:competence protein ComEC
MLLGDFVRIIFAEDVTKVIFCDVGQGDAILVVRGSFQLLVDAGSGSSVLTCLNNHMPAFDRTIELVVITHPHFDHYGGMSYVMANYRVDNIMIDNFVQSDLFFYEFYNLLMDRIESNELHQFVSSENMRLRFFEDFFLEVIHSRSNLPPEDIFAERLNIEELSALKTEIDQIERNLNNVSIVVNLHIEDKIITLTGDLEEARELALVRSGVLDKVDVLKIPHHGSKSSSSPEFLEILLPEIAVITVGRNNRYRHPHADVVSRLENLPTRIYRTDQHGEIVMEIRNGEITVLTEIDL